MLNKRVHPQVKVSYGEIVKWELLMLLLIVYYVNAQRGRLHQRPRGNLSGTNFVHLYGVGTT